LKEKRISNDKLAASLKPIQELETVPIKFVKVLLSPDGEETLLLLESEGRQYVFPVSRLEASSIIYHANGFGERAHIPNIFMVYLKTMKGFRFTLMSVVLEAKAGDATYARLVWQDAEHKKAAQVVSVGDAVNLSVLTKTPMKIVKNMLAQLCPIDDWPYFDEIEDWSF
jgi:bifunctional DNase/RNase